MCLVYFGNGILLVRNAVVCLKVLHNWFWKWRCAPDSFSGICKKRFSLLYTRTFFRGQPKHKIFFIQGNCKTWAPLLLICCTRHCSRLMINLGTQVFSCACNEHLKWDTYTRLCVNACIHLVVSTNNSNVQSEREISKFGQTNKHVVLRIFVFLISSLNQHGICWSSTINQWKIPFH